jgi:ribosomal protein L23
VVDHRATRAEIRRAVEEIYNCKVMKVNTKIVRSGKIATVRFTKDYSAEDIGSRAGVF